MDHQEFEILKREIIYRGRVFTVLRDEVRHRSGYESVREVVEHHGGAVVVALLPADGAIPDPDVLLVRQFRYPFQERLIELPAGKLDSGEEPAHCAARELEEETGWTAGSLARLGEYLSTPGFCGERLHLFLARDLRPGTRRLEQGEESMEVLRVPLLEALAWCRNGVIRDGKTVAGLMLAAMETGVLRAGDA